MANYVISPQTREIFRQAREELERREQALAEQNQIPPQVAAFWTRPNPGFRRGNLLSRRRNVNSETSAKPRMLD